MIELNDIPSFSIPSFSSSSFLDEEQQICYLIYASFDIVFALIALYRLICAFVVSCKMRKNTVVVDSTAGDPTTPLVNEDSPSNRRSQVFDLGPKFTFFGLTFLTCIICFALHVLMSFKWFRDDVAEHGIYFQLYSVFQLLTDACMTISFSLVAISCVELFLMVSSESNNSEKLYNQTLGGENEIPERKGFLHFLVRMPYKQQLLTVFVGLISVVIIILVFCVPHTARSDVITAEHIIMSTLVFIAYLSLFIVSIAFSFILKNAHQSLAQKLRFRILVLCLSASCVGVIRYPFDILVATKIFKMTDNPVVFVTLALFFRFVPYGLICILMWPLPKPSYDNLTHNNNDNNNVK